MRETSPISWRGLLEGCEIFAELQPVHDPAILNGERIGPDLVLEPDLERSPMRVACPAVRVEFTLPCDSYLDTLDGVISRWDPGRASRSTVAAAQPPDMPRGAILLAFLKDPPASLDDEGEAAYLAESTLDELMKNGDIQAAAARAHAMGEYWHGRARELERK